MMLGKEIILGTSDAWSMRQLSQRPSNPAYYIEDCRIFELFDIDVTSEVT